MHGCEYPLRRICGTASAIAMVWFVAAQLVLAEPMQELDTRYVEGVPPGEVVYSMDESYIAPPSQSYSPYGMNYSTSLGAHLRARYNTRSYGQVRGNLDLGTMKLWDAPNGAWFVDGQATLNDESKFGYNLGVGYRFMTLPLLPYSADDAKIAGISLWTDGTTTINDNFLPQIGLSLEFLGDNWDARMNGYLPLADDVETGEFDVTDTITYSGDFLVQEVLAGTDEPLTVLDAELARRFGNRDLWLFGGTYGLWGDTTDTAGLKLGARGYLTPDLAVQLAVNDDDVFGTNTVFSVTWFIGRTRDPRYCTPSLHNRLREPVIRNDYVAVRQGTLTDGINVQGDLDGDGVAEDIRVVHVDSAAADGGDGSFENPLNELVDINATGASPALVLVHAGSTFDTDTADLLSGQRLLGEGGGIEHIVSTTNFGDIVLPESFDGASTGAVPVITNVAGDVITLQPGTLEVSNFVINGGDRAVVSPAGSLGVDLNNLDISDTNSDAIVLTAASETVDSDLRVRFQPMLSDLTFDNIGGDDINIDATSPEAASVPVTESIAISDVTSTNGQGVGINLQNNRSAATITNYSNDMGTGLAAIVLDGSDGNVTITDATITNQTGMGVSVQGGSGSHTLNGMTITDTGAAAVHVDGGSADINYTGSITQGSTGEVLLAEGGHTGDLSFFAETGATEIVNATSGDGLVFSDADGTYTFLDGVTLVGTTQGIDATTDSDGTLTLLDATITDPNGIAVHVDGGDFSMNYTGSITQGNAFETVFVEGNHEGTLTFDEGTSGAGVINATNGDGLVFNQADGGYLFNDGVVLDGSGAGADTKLNMIDSDGTFTFADATITDPTGAAVNVDGGSAILTLTGEITQSNNAAALNVTNGHDGTLTFLSPDSTTDVITATNGTGLQFNNADGDYGLVGSVALNGGDAGVDIINGSDGTFTFGDTEITSPTGIAFNVIGGTADVDFTGKITQASNFAAVSVTGGHNGTMDFDESTAGAGVVEATNGTGLQFDNADGTYRFNDAVVLSGGDAGVDITNGSSGTFNFASDSAITNPTNEAFVITDSNANVDYNGTITNNADNSVRIENNTGGTVTFDGVITDTGAGILVQNNTGGSYSFNGGTDLDTGATDAVTLLNNSGTTLSFRNMDINTTTGNGFRADNSEGLQILSATGGNDNTITSTTGTALSLTDVTVTGSGMAINSVSSNGAVNGIVMEDVTGGPVFIGTAGSTVGDGGSILNSTGTGVLLTNVEDVSLNFLEVDSTGAVGIDVVHDNTTTTAMNVNISDSLVRDTVGEGILVNASSAADFSITLDNNTVDQNGGESVSLNINGSANNADLIVTNNTIDNTAGEEALLITGNDATSKTINLLVQDNTVNADSATTAAAVLESNGDATINATYLGNGFTNADVGGIAFTADTNAAGSRLNLRMEDNTASSGGALDDYILTENAGIFRVQNLTTPNGDGETIDTANTGTFDIDANITEFAGTVPQP